MPNRKKNINSNKIKNKLKNKVKNKVKKNKKRKTKKTTSLKLKGGDPNPLEEVLSNLIARSIIEDSKEKYQEAQQKREQVISTLQSLLQHLPRDEVIALSMASENLAQEKLFYGFTYYDENGKEKHQHSRKDLIDIRYILENLDEFKSRGYDLEIGGLRRRSRRLKNRKNNL